MMTRKEITDAFNSLSLDARKEYLEALKGELEHLYRIGAGAYVGNYLTEYSKSASDIETAAIRNYLDDLAAIKTYDGNIITTHERILLENKNSSLFQGRRGYSTCYGIGKIHLQRRHPACDARAIPIRTSL